MRPYRPPVCGRPGTAAMLTALAGDHVPGLGRRLSCGLRGRRVMSASSMRCATAAGQRGNAEAAAGPGLRAGGPGRRLGARSSDPRRRSVRPPAHARAPDPEEHAPVSDRRPVSFAGAVFSGGYVDLSEADSWSVPPLGRMSTRRTRRSDCWCLPTAPSTGCPFGDQRPERLVSADGESPRRRARGAGDRPRRRAGV